MASEYTFGPFELIKRERQLTREGVVVPLQPKSLDVLHYLITHAGNLVEKQELMQAVWGETIVTDNSLTRCIQRVRVALDDDADSPAYIETVAGAGYRFIGHVEDINDQPQRTRPGVLPVFAILLVIVTAGIWFNSRDSRIPAQGLQIDQSIGVMPFQNLSDSSRHDYFADGLAEVLSTALGRIPLFRVVTNNSVLYFKQRDIDLQDVAEQLGVRTLLTGSVQRDAERVRIVASLIEAATGKQLWANSYDREFSNIFEIQDDIANSVVAAMRLSMAGMIVSSSTDDNKAYDKFLRGLVKRNKMGFKSLSETEILFKESIAMDPSYFEARLELANTNWAKFLINATTREEAAKKDQPLLQGLLEEQPENGSALSLSIQVEYYKHFHSVNTADREKYLAELTIVVSRTPNEPKRYLVIAELLSNLDRKDESLIWLDKGLLLDPFYWQMHAKRSRALKRCGNLVGGEEAIMTAVRINPESLVLLSTAHEFSWLRKDYVGWFALARKEMDMDSADSDHPVFIGLNLYTFGLMKEGDK